MSPVVEDNIFKLLPWAVNAEDDLSIVADNNDTEIENIYKKTRHTMFFSPSQPRTPAEGRPVVTPAVPSFPPPCVPHVLENGEGESDKRSTSDNFDTAPLHISQQVYALNCR